jgi:hypothetical protein
MNEYDWLKGQEPDPRIRLDPGPWLKGNGVIKLIPSVVARPKRIGHEGGAG